MKTELLKLSFKDYCDIDAINSSKLKDFFADPKLFYKTYITKTVEKPEEERHFVVGRAIHCLVLEPEEFNKNFMVGERRKSTKLGVANHAIAQDSGLSLISEDEHLLCQSIAAELPEQYEWSKYHRDALNIYSEIVILLELENGIKLKVMLDRCIEHADVVYVDDIKSTSKNNDSDFDDAIAEYDYLLQFAFYKYVVEQHFGKPCIFRFVFCSKNEPFNIAFIRMNDTQADTGFKVVDYALSKYVHGQKTGEWYNPQVYEREAILPAYKMKKYLTFLGN
jgi:exodeoxyribonuclease VIII